MHEFTVENHRLTSVGVLRVRLQHGEFCKKNNPVPVSECFRYARFGVSSVDTAFLACLLPMIVDVYRRRRKDERIDRNRNEPVVFIQHLAECGSIVASYSLEHERLSLSSAAGRRG